VVRSGGGKGVGPLREVQRKERASKGSVEDAGAPRKEIGGFLFYFMFLII